MILFSYGLLFPKKEGTGKAGLGKAAAIFGDESSEDEVLCTAGLEMLLVPGFGCLFWRCCLLWRFLFVFPCFAKAVKEL